MEKIKKQNVRHKTVQKEVIESSITPKHLEVNSVLKEFNLEDWKFGQIDLYMYAKLTKLKKNELLLWIRKHLMSSSIPVEVMEKITRTRVTTTGLPGFPTVKTNIRGAEGYLYADYYSYDKGDMVKVALKKHIEKCSSSANTTDPLWWLEHEEWEEICRKLLELYHHQIMMRKAEREINSLHDSFKNWDSVDNNFELQTGFTQLEYNAIMVIGEIIVKVDIESREEIASRLTNLLKLGEATQTKTQTSQTKKKAHL